MGWGRGAGKGGRGGKSGAGRQRKKKEFPAETKRGTKRPAGWDDASRRVSCIAQNKTVILLIKFIGWFVYEHFA